MLRCDILGSELASRLIKIYPSEREVESRCCSTHGIKSARGSNGGRLLGPLMRETMRYLVCFCRPFFFADRRIALVLESSPYIYNSGQSSPLSHRACHRTAARSTGTQLRKWREWSYLLQWRCLRRRDNNRRCSSWPKHISERAQSR